LLRSMRLASLCSFAFAALRLIPQPTSRRPTSAEKTKARRILAFDAASVDSREKDRVATKVDIVKPIPVRTQIPTTILVSSFFNIVP